jgi:predicted nucleic acid-binding protein
VNLWYIDTNVLISVVTNRSPAARAWYVHTLQHGGRLMASQFMEVEARHLVTNAGGDHTVLDGHLGRFHIDEVDAALMHAAIAVPGVISGADAVHLATALRVRDDSPVIVTHDGQFARAAAALALGVHDPITDDPDRPPVATFRSP